MMLSNRLAKHFGAAAAAATVVGAANAAVVTWNLNLAVPNTFYGVYLNIATQTTGGTAGTTSGFDLNPYGAADLKMFWGAGATYVRTQAAGGASSLPVGTEVGASSAFGNSLTAVVSGTTVSNGWQLNSANYFGFRFNHDTLGLRYGYGVMQVGANSQDRTLVSISWEDSGGSIVVPAPGAMALLGLAGLAGRRRRR
jgi:MYXO-CTERM domain-containing protein